MVSKHTSERVSSRLVSVHVTSDLRYAVLVEQRSAVLVWGLVKDDGEVRRALKVITTAEALVLLDDRTLVAGTTYANLLIFNLEQLNGDGQF